MGEQQVLSKAEACQSGKCCQGCISTGTHRGFRGKIKIKKSDVKGVRVQYAKRGLLHRQPK